MRNFKWCVWLVPNDDHPWNFLTNGFPPHMTIRHSLTLEQAAKIAGAIDFKPMQIKLDGNIRYTMDQGFSALSILLTPIDNPPKWWPEKAHISFRYDYNYFTEQDAKELQQQITVLDGELVTIKVVDCSKEFTKWGKE